MNFSDFLTQATNKSFWEQNKIICFSGKEYSFLFINNLFKLLQEKNALAEPYRSLILESTDENKLQSHLQQSFLGQKTFYWLGECDSKETTKKKNTLDFLIEYKGPNFIAFFLNEDKITTKISNALQKITLIELEQCNESLFAKITTIFDKNFSKEKLDLVKKIFLKINIISIDQAFLLMQYIEIISLKAAEKSYEYLLNITSTLKPELYTLSQYFFNKQHKTFFSTWSKIQQDYPEMFWISFWAEQIWRAFYVTKFLKENNFAKAKSLSFRLPFSFLKNDWKTFSLNELANAYEFLYTSDFKLKTGSTICSLDMFFLNHFLGNFTEKGR
jgi:hypothetical protein